MIRLLTLMFLVFGFNFAFARCSCDDALLVWHFEDGTPEFLPTNVAPEYIFDCEPDYRVIRVSTNVAAATYGTVSGLIERYLHASPGFFIYNAGYDNDLYPGYGVYDNVYDQVKYGGISRIEWFMSRFSTASLWDSGSYMNPSNRVIRSMRIFSDYPFSSVWPAVRRVSAEILDIWAGPDDCTWGSTQFCCEKDDVGIGQGYRKIDKDGIETYLPLSPATGQYSDVGNWVEERPRYWYGDDRWIASVPNFNSCTNKVPSPSGEWVDDIMIVGNDYHYAIEDAMRLFCDEDTKDYAVGISVRPSPFHPQWILEEAFQDRDVWPSAETYARAFTNALHLTNDTLRFDYYRVGGIQTALRALDRTYMPGHLHNFRPGHDFNWNGSNFTYNVGRSLWTSSTNIVNIVFDEDEDRYVFEFGEMPNSWTNMESVSSWAVTNPPVSRLFPAFYNSGGEIGCDCRVDAYGSFNFHYFDLDNILKRAWEEWKREYANTALPPSGGMLHISIPGLVFTPAETFYEVFPDYVFVEVYTNQTTTFDPDRNRLAYSEGLYGVPISIFPSDISDYSFRIEILHDEENLWTEPTFDTNTPPASIGYPFAHTFNRHGFDATVTEIATRRKNSLAWYDFDFVSWRALTTDLPVLGSDYIYGYRGNGDEPSTILDKLVEFRSRRLGAYTKLPEEYSARAASNAFVTAWQGRRLEHWNAVRSYFDGEIPAGPNTQIQAMLRQDAADLSYWFLQQRPHCHTGITPNTWSKWNRISATNEVGVWQSGGAELVDSWKVELVSTNYDFEAIGELSLAGIHDFALRICPDWNDFNLDEERWDQEYWLDNLWRDSFFLFDAPGTVSNTTYRFHFENTNYLYKTSLPLNLGSAYIWGGIDDTSIKEAIASGDLYLPYTNIPPHEATGTIYPHFDTRWDFMNFRPENNSSAW